MTKAKRGAGSFVKMRATDWISWKALPVKDGKMSVTRGTDQQDPILMDDIYIGDALNE